VLHATGGATTVWLNIPQGKAVPMPDWLRRVLE
jgi:acyl-CoA thioesterase FadM